MHKSSLFRAAGLLLAALLTPGQVAAHSERAAFFPDNRVTQRPDYRPLLPTPQAQRLVVCKKPGNEGVGAREDSSSRIARIQEVHLLVLHCLCDGVDTQLLGEQEIPI